MNPPFYTVSGRLLTAALYAFLSGMPTAQAADIGYTLTPLGSDFWRYEYTLDNRAGGPAFNEFTVYFDLPNALQIVSFTVPSGWDGLVVQVDPGLPASGYIDAVHGAGLVASGSTVAGFTVAVHYAAGLTPGAQTFELAVAAPFQIVQTGMTSAIPEPDASAMLLSGLAVFVWLARSNRPRPGAKAASGVQS